jgi:hypothetical protein
MGRELPGVIRNGTLETGTADDLSASIAAFRISALNRHVFWSAFQNRCHAGSADPNHHATNHLRHRIAGARHARRGEYRADG